MKARRDESKNKIIIKTLYPRSNVWISFSDHRPQLSVVWN